MSNGVTENINSQLKIERATNTKALSDFYCGIEIMDEYIHSGLQDAILSNQQDFYIVYQNQIPIAFFCLENASYFISDSAKEKILSQSKPSPKPGLEPDSIFWDLTNHPSVEISYFAVRKDCRLNGIGRAVINSIIKKLSVSSEYTQPVLTVRALQTEDGEYSAVGFYEKCGFSLGEDYKTKKNLLMYRVIPR